MESDGKLSCGTICWNKKEGELNDLRKYEEAIYCFEKEGKFSQCIELAIKK